MHRIDFHRWQIEGLVIKSLIKGKPCVSQSLHSLDGGIFQITQTRNSCVYVMDAFNLYWVQP